MGLLAAFDATGVGTIGKDAVKWRVNGIQGGYSSPVIDGDRIYEIDNGSMLFAFDLKTGKQLWNLKLGTIQKSSLVLGDGKLYVGTESGKFYILKPGQDKCEILDEKLLGTEQHPEQVLGSVAISRGRVYMVSSDHLYAIGKKINVPVQTVTRPNDLVGSPSYLLVVPTDVTLQPSEKARFRARVYDKQGNFIGEQSATWTLEQLKGQIAENGGYIVSSDRMPAGRTSQGNDRSAFGRGKSSNNSANAD